MEPAIEVLDIPPLAHGEGPVWSEAEQAFYFLDIKGRRLHRLAWPQRTHDSFALPAEVGCMAPIQGGGLALALPDRLCRFRPGVSELPVIASFDPGGANRRSNDGAVDRQGRFWFSTVADPGWRDEPTGSVWCCDTNGQAHCVMQGLFMPNGIAAAGDGEMLYLSDSHPDIRRIWTFRLRAAGGGGQGEAASTAAPTLTEGRILYDTAGRPGRPDGAALDALGGYWMAGVGGGELVRITADGMADRVIALPVSHPTKACFGGADLDVMLLTTMQPAALGVAATPTPVPGGSVLLVRPQVPGLPQKAFICGQE